MPKAIALCTPVSDYLIHVDKIPQPNTGARLIEHSWQNGGNAATAIVTCARQGVDSGIIGYIGDDLNGQSQRVDFTRHGVDITHLKVKEGMTTPYSICLSDEETDGRAFLGARKPTPRFPVEELDMDYVNSAKYLLLDSNTEATQKAATAIKQKGGEVMFDASAHSEAQEAMLPFTTVYIASEFYLKARYGEGANLFDCCRDMISKGPHTVIFTLGAEGCAGVGPQGEFRLAAFPIPHVVDTTGAGDTFHGAYISAMDRGIQTAEECARWASATSAFKCCAIGGRAGQPTADLVERFLRTGEMDLSFVEERIQYYSRPHYLMGE